MNRFNITVLGQFKHERRNNLKINPKFEIRNTKQYLNSKFKCSKLLNLGHLIFEFVSSFDIRISRFLI